MWTGWCHILTTVALHELHTLHTVKSSSAEDAARADFTLLYLDSTSPLQVSAMHQYPV